MVYVFLIVLIVYLKKIMDIFLEGTGMCRFLSSSRMLSWMAPLTLVVVLFNELTIHGCTFKYQSWCVVLCTNIDECKVSSVHAGLEEVG